MQKEPNQGYSAIIAKSVAETGYEHFKPSACVSTPDEEEMSVLDIELKEEGETSDALSWGATLLKEGAVLFLAYRSGNHVVTVAEVHGRSIVQKMNIHVRPHDES
jgi:hypothetical protein